MSQPAHPPSTSAIPLADRVRAGIDRAAGNLPRTFWVLCAGTLVNRAGSFVLIYLSVYLTQVRGHSVRTAGLVAALYGAGAALASVLGGSLADHLGRRATMIAALSLGGLGMIALGFAHDIRLIGALAFLVALLGEAYRPAVQAAVSDVVPAHDRIRAFGLLYWVVNVGFSIGALLGGVLASRSFLLLFLCDGLTSMLFAILIARAVPETRPKTTVHPHATAGGGVVHDFVAPFRDGPFGMFVLLSVLILLVFWQHVSAQPIDMTAKGVPRAMLGMVLAINGIVIVLLQPLVAASLQRLNRSRVLAAGSLLVALGFGLNALAHGPGLFALGALIWTLGEICVLPIGNAVVADIAPSHMRGRYQGAFGLSFGLSAFSAPLIGTFVLERYGAAALWSGCLGLGVLVAIGHLLLAPALTHLREQRLAARSVTVTGSGP